MPNSCSVKERLSSWGTPSPHLSLSGLSSSSTRKKALRFYVKEDVR
jgi:hypothetical protein